MTADGKRGAQSSADTLVGVLVEKIEDQKARIADLTKALQLCESSRDQYMIYLENARGMAVCQFPELKDEPNPYECVRRAFKAIDSWDRLVHRADGQ